MGQKTQNDGNSSNGTTGTITVKCEKTGYILNGYPIKGTLDDARSLQEKNNFPNCPYCEGTDCLQVIFQYYNSTEQDNYFLV